MGKIRLSDRQREIVTAMMNGTRLELRLRPYWGWFLVGKDGREQYVKSASVNGLIERGLVFKPGSPFGYVVEKDLQKQLEQEARTASGNAAPSHN